MQHLGLLFTLSVLALNLWGLMLIAGLYWRQRWFALAVGPILGVTTIYAIECHHGLGRSLGFLGLVSTLLSAGMIAFSVSAWEPEWLGVRGTALIRAWRDEFVPRKLIGCFSVCAVVFLYAMSWRFIYPNIDGSSEKIADFSYICSYYTGATLPVPDVWFYPYLSTQYYSFQHYGAALMGRILLLPPGSAYNLGYCLLIALGGTAFAGAVAVVARKPSTRAMVIACFVIGGTGITLLDHLTDKNVNPWTTMRFIGSAQMDKPPVGTWLKAYQQKFQIVEGDGKSFAMELPGEIYSYVVFLGDFHAPLSGYYLLGLCGMGMLLWNPTRQARYPAIAGATLTWTLLANTWVLPLQGLAVFVWLAIQWRDWRRLIPAVALGAAVVWLAAWVYLAAFTQAAAGYNTAVRLVPWNEHTPPLLFLLFFLPTICFIILGFVSGTHRGRLLALVWLGMLLFSEFFFVDDEYTGHFDRFNTTLKWWPWVMAGTLMTLAPIVIEQARWRWVRIVGIVFCLYPCFYVYDLWDPMWNGPKDAMGKIDGTFYLTRDDGTHRYESEFEFPRLMLDRLKVEKPGVCIERPDEQGGFVNSAVVPLFAGQKMWLGWWGHELLWRENREDVRRRHTLLMLFYSGGKPDAGPWLLSQGIDYVLWFRPGDTPDLWAKINKAVSPEYVWVDILTYQDEDGRRVGFWRRPPKAPR
jgi:uncharacterized membrane protein